MAFLAPLAISAGGSIVSSLLGSKLAGGPNAQQQQATQGLQQAQQQGAQSSKSLLGMGTGALQQPINYWSSLLSGNRGQMTAALAPDINKINEGYTANRQAAAQLTPRGGGRASLLQGLPYAQQRDITTLFQQARPMAAQSMAGAGANLLGQSTGMLQASTSAGRDILAAQEAERQRQAQQGKSIGGGLFSMFQQYGMPALEGKFPGLFGGGGGKKLNTSTDTSSGGIYPY